MGRMLSNKLYPRRGTTYRPLPVQLPPAMRPAPAGAAPSNAPDPSATTALGRFFLYCALATLFVRLTVLPEVIAYYTGANSYLLYLVAPPAVIGVLLTGGLRRAFRTKAPYLWMGFFAWMVIATPFSSWRGGSVDRVVAYGKTELMFLVLIAGLTFTWKDIRAVIYTIALSAMVNLLFVNLFRREEFGRISLEATGSIGNSNDLAAHLLLVLPFLYYFALEKGRFILIRVFALLLIAYGAWVIVGTASRGAVIAMAMVILCILARASMGQRVALLLIMLFLGAGLVALLPNQTALRLGTLVGEQDKEAKESTESRLYLFEKSVEYTVEHPIVGVGPDQFSNFEGKSSLAQGQHGNWHATHCAFTQISSECGIPGLLFFGGSLISALLMVRRTYRRAKAEGYADIADACFCLLLSMVGYLGALVFLAEGYGYKLPLLVGLAVAFSFAAQFQMRAVAPGTGAPGAVGIQLPTQHAAAGVRIPSRARAPSRFVAP